MIYEALARIIAGLCFRVGTPVTASRVSQLLGHLFDDDLVEGVCRRMLDEGKLLRVADGAFTVRALYSRLACLQVLVSPEYQQLGMTIMTVDNGDWARCISPNAEHRFLEIKPSTIGRDAGMGLFVRSTRRIPLGCIICEYRGRELHCLPHNFEQGDYVVRVRGTGTYIDGVTAAGEPLSLAAFINDNGPQWANAGMVEYAHLPGRVFVMANRDLQPGEELFVLYGATYWGFTSYTELAQQARGRREAAERRRREEDQRKKEQRQKRSSRKRPGEDGDCEANNDALSGGDSDSELIPFLETFRDCRSCGQPVLRRAAKLHSEHCGDPLVHRKLDRLDCMPHSEFTALDTPSAVLSSCRTKALHRAKTFVTLSDPQTFSHTYVDVVEDFEFTFEDKEESNTVKDGS